MFGGEGIVGVPGDPLDPRAGEQRDGRTVAAADGGERAGVEIDGDVRVLGEQAHAALGAQRDAAGDEGGDAAVLESQAGVGDILMRPGDRGADGVDGDDRAGDEGEDEVDVVDHQVENDRHVGAARLERGDAGALDVVGLRHAGADGAVLGGVAQQVADLQDAPIGGGEGRHVVGLGEGGGDRFFDQDMLAGRQRRYRQAVMQVGGGGDDDGVTGGEERVQRHGLGVGFAGDLRRPGGVGVVDAGEGRARGSGDLLGVKAPEMAGADDADAQWGGRGHGGPEGAS